MVTWQAFRISTKIISNRSSIIFNFFPTCSFFNWNMIPGSLLPLFNICQILAPKNKADTPSLSYQNDITLCSVSEQLVYECRWHEILPRSSIQRCMLINFPLDLCYANQDLHRGSSILGSRHKLRSHLQATSTSERLYFLKLFLPLRRE